MASGKNSRQERRMPTFYVMVTAVVFVAFCLTGAWVLNSPSESRVSEESKSAYIEVKKKHRTEPYSESKQTFEDNAGDLALENEEKADDTPQQQLEGKESSEVPTEEKEEEPSEKKESKKTSEKRSPERKEPEEPKTDVLETELDSSEGDATSKLEKGTEMEDSSVEQNVIMPETKETSDTWDTQASESKKKKEMVVPEEKEKSEDETVEDENESKQEKGKVQLSKNQKANDQTLGDGNYSETLTDTKSSKKRKEKNLFKEDTDIASKQEIEWTMCDSEGAIDYIPCLDNMKALKALHSTKHYEHRERHCPDLAPTCLVPLPEGYRTPIRWPQSRNEVWFANVPHPGLISYKKDQNWVKKNGNKLIFPGGGTQFKHGALHYIDYVNQSFPKISWGKRTRVILDVGCGVASFGGYIFERDVLTMSFAPKDEHEAQVQLALERGIPAISAVMGTQRLVFPSNVYDAVHCARCRVPWHIEGGKLLLELNRILRPGGYFVWSATPVYWTDEEDVHIWKEMRALTSAICWKLVAKFFDASTGIGAAVYQKPTTNSCYENRKKNFPPMCDEDDKPDAAWYVPMMACIHRIPGKDSRGFEWPQEGPLRLTEAPMWLNNQKGANGKSTAAADFLADTKRWQQAVQKSYLKGFGIDWTKIRNVMDMRTVYGGFAAALSSQPVWVMNVVLSDGADTLAVIFDRGLFGLYHDWCESFSSYPRTYDLLHADHLLSRLKKRCKVKSLVVEMDRLLRPGGWVIVRDESDLVNEVQSLFESLHWEIRMTFSQGTEGLLAVQKTKWRPEATF